MSLYTASLNSGSNGNCYYIGNDHDAVLVDAGLSCREMEARLQRLSLPVSKIRAIFISHEHTDHVKGLVSISKKYQIPIYITTNTMRKGGFVSFSSGAHHFTAYNRVSIGDLEVTAFPKYHDACDPYSFIIGCNGVRVGVFTDIGSPCDHVIRNFKQCHAAFLESNYDDGMLDSGAYPYHLKKRIRGGMGHLSNKQALDLFLNHRPEYMTHLFLSHLSKDNNCPKLVEELFTRNAGAIKIVVASRYQESAVYKIIAQPHSTPIFVTPKPASAQLAFSF